MILTALPQQFTLPVIIVVHLPQDKKSVLAEILQAKCQIAVQEADDKELLQAGTAYLAPPNYHLLIEHDKSLSLSSDEAVLYSRPSIDVLFESAADAYGPALLCIVLTGANRDGAQGMRKIMDAGGKGIVQTPDSAYAAAMPQAAIDLCPEAKVLSLNEIADYLQKVR